MKAIKPSSVNRNNFRTLASNYIIRIYRRGGKGTDMCVGLIEEIGVKDTKRFQSFEELVGILRNGGLGRAGKIREKKG